MSWHISAEGSPEQCIAVARERAAELQASLPETEQGKIEQVIDAAESLLQNAVELEAKVTLNVSGSHEELDGKVQGTVSIGASYYIAEPPPARKAENE